MAETKLLKKIHMNCPICDKLHEVEERKRVTTTIIKDEEVTYEERFYFCANAEEEESEFETGSMTNQNLLNARNAYRIKRDLLTSNEIIEIRESYGMSQVDLARLLGWGEATISRYESKAIQDDAYDAMLRLIKDNPLQALEFLKKNSDKFTPAKQYEIRKKIVEKLDFYGKEFLSRQRLEGVYAEFDEPSDANGYTTLNIDKVEAVTSYLAKYMSYFYKVKFMKSLWYADALAYKQTGKAITGLVYCHEAMGALPVGHYSLMNLENINVQEEMTYNSNYDSMSHIYPSERVDYSVLTKEEIEILNKIIDKFKNYKATEIVKYMHEEKAYKETSAGAIIPFFLAKEIRELSCN